MYINKGPGSSKHASTNNRKATPLNKGRAKKVCNAELIR